MSHAPTHRVSTEPDAIHFPHYRAGLPAWATCTCGKRVEAMPDQFARDPWEALSEAWTRHKGVVPGRGNARAEGLSKAETARKGGLTAAAIQRAKVGAF